MRTALRLTVGLAVSFGCLYFATRGTDWGEVSRVLAGARPLWALAVLGVSLTTIYIRAERWRVLLRPVGELPLYPAVSATAVGFGASAVLPLRLGEIVRPALLARSTRIPMSAALSSVVIERVFDMLLVIGCFLGMSLLVDIRDDLRHGAWVLAGLAVSGFVFLLVIAWNRATAERLLMRVVELFPARAARRLRPTLSSLLDGLGALADGRAVAVVLGYSALLWTAIVLSFLCAFLALDIPVPLVRASLTAMVVVAAFIFLPQGPGFVGTWQAGTVLALGLFGVSREVAIGYSLLTWLLQMIVNLGAAGFFVSREGLSIGQLVRASSQEREPVEVEAS